MYKEPNPEEVARMRYEGTRRMPRNGVWTTPSTYAIVVVAGNALRRGATNVIVIDQNKTYTLPKTVSTIIREAFRGKNSLASIRLNEGLETLETACLFSPVAIKACPE